MTRAEAVAQIKQKLGFMTDLDAEIVTALQQMQTFAEEQQDRTPPWFLRTYDVPFAITAGEQNYDLPMGFIQELDELDVNLRYQPTPNQRAWFLRKYEEEEAEKFFFGDWQSVWDTQVQPATLLSPGFPRAYVRRATQVRIYPVPDRNYTLLWNYIKADDPLASDTTENKWLRYAPWVLIGKAGQMIAADTRDAEAQQIFAGMLQSAEKALLAKTIDHEEAGRRRSMGRRL